MWPDRRNFVWGLQPLAETIVVMDKKLPFRVLSLDGGGMRGTYTATYLAQVTASFAARRCVAGLDIGAAFNLITGTSTGGIIACALAAGIPLSAVIDLYRKHGPAIFPRKLPTTIAGVGMDMRMRPGSLKSGAMALATALKEVLGSQTMAELYAKRKIALAIPAIEMSQHRSWVFKTPHLPGTNHRDDGYTLADVCLATTAAPIYRSMAPINHPNTVNSGYNVFVDGGLWANNPVLVGLIDALELTAPGDRIEIFCLGTCPVPAGEQLRRDDVNRGLNGWKFGGEAASLAIDAQAFAFDNMARMLARHVDRDCSVIRFPADKVPGALMPYLELDDTSPAAAEALINQARTDADMTNSRCTRSDDPDSRTICELFSSAPVLTHLPVAGTPRGGLAIKGIPHV